MNRSIAILLGSILIALPKTGATAQEIETSPIQIALVTPVQIVSADRAISGVRWNVLYGRNAYVVGLDFGLVNHTTTGVSQGLQIGLVNLVDGAFVGWQDGGVNITRDAFEGLQSGAVNSVGDGTGMQWGVVNVADRHNGLQLGVVNYARQLHGLQIGLVNVIKQGGAFPVFPIVNWSF